MPSLSERQSSMIMNCCSREAKPEEIKNEPASDWTFETADNHREETKNEPIDITNGIDVIVWQMAPQSYSFACLPHVDETRDWLDPQLLSLKGSGLEDVKGDLKSSGFSRDQIHIIPWQNPISSYLPEYAILMDGENQELKVKRYITSIRQMLFDLRSIKDLQTLVPEYFMDKSFKGIELYLWKENDELRCGVMPGTNRMKTSEEIDNLKNKSVSVEEMGMIFDHCETDRSEVFVIMRDTLTQSERLYVAEVLGLDN